MRRSSPLALVVVVCLAFGPVALAQEIVVLHDTAVTLDRALVRGAEASAFVSVRGSTDLDQHQPIGGAEVALALVRVGDAEKEKRKELARHDLAQVTTSPRGEATVRFVVPEVEPGSYLLRVRTRSQHGEDTVEQPVTVAARVVVHLRTDRPVYRAGQSLRWRVTVLSAADAHPRKNALVELAIADPRGTKIWRGRVTTDETGMVSGALPLGEDLILGVYQLTASCDGMETRESVKVQDFVLPPFSVEVRPTTKGPVAAGSPIEGEVQARYAYGEPVAGELSFQASGSAAQTATLDDQGRWRFSLVAPTEGDSVLLTARVTDGAGRSRSASAEVPLHSERLELAVVPERREFVPGEDLAVTVITTDGRGNFIPARVFLARAGQSRRQGGPSPGVTRFTVTPGERDWSLYLDATAITEDGRAANERIYVRRAAGGASVHVRDAVVKERETIHVEGKWPKLEGPLVATLLRGGAPVATAVATTSASEGGAFAAELTAPEGVFGLATVRVVDTGYDPMTGVISATTAQATVYLRPARLEVAVSGATRHAPGSDVKLAVQVTDAQGRPVAGAGLAASVVDERVLALGERRPDLGKILDGLDVTSAPAAGVAFADLLDRAGANERLARRAIIESLPPDPAMPLIRSDAAERVREERARLIEAQPAVYDVILVDPRPIARRSGGASWEFASELDELLARAGWKERRRITPWKRPTSWAYARKLFPAWTFDNVAPDVANERLDRLERKLRKVKRARHALHKKPDTALGALVEAGAVPAYLAVDPWGQAIRVVREVDDEIAYITLVSAGPDAVFDTLDDLERADVFRESPGGIGLGGFGVGSGGGAGAGFGRGAGVAGVRIGAAIGDQSMVAVRQRFDETVLWVTGVRTGADGTASLEVPLADSITGWEVQVEATSPRGAVGTGSARLETFLPLHVDADVPSTLTRGDRYSISVVVANHSGRDRTLAVDAVATGAVSLRGEARRSITLASGATAALAFPVDANAVGAGTMEVTLSDAGRPVDAMKRSVRVDPPGSLVREIQSGALAKGTSRMELAVPELALAGTAIGRLRVFRGAADQAMDGLEALLSEPHGCFEQTSSSTHPNLLVLDLLRDQRGAEEIRRRAEDYVARGYQRLVSYEVPGGGFSWFGDAPANQVLTAYGVLEFTDMARVYPVDPALIERTRKWLLGKQQRDGSWKPDEAWLHDWSAVQGKVSTTAYIAWALAESGYRGKGLTSALGFLRGHQGALAKDPYLLGLWAGAEAAAGGKPAAPMALLGEHETRAEGELRFRAGGRTLFYSSGTGADVQVTALAATTLGRTGKRADAVAALAWVWGAREEGGWDSTQGVVMALRAAASLHSREPPPGGKIDVSVDGRVVGQLDLDGDGVPTVELPGLAAGKHAVTLAGAPDGLLYDLRLTYREDGNPQASNRGIGVELTPLAGGAAIGENVPLSIKLRNEGTETVPMPTVVVPVPPGFRAATPSLEALVTKRLVSKFEDLGSEIHLYLVELPAGSARELRVEWEAVAECDVMQRPAVAYAYYDPATRGSSAIARLAAWSRRNDPARAAAPAAKPRPVPLPRTAYHRPALP